jgi:hypothetical protein
MTMGRSQPQLTPSFFVIQRRQRDWARSNGIPFDSRDRVREMNENLVRELNPETLAEFQDADGSELEDKIRALNSSAALVCNVFDWWRYRPEAITVDLGLPKEVRIQLKFEQKAPIFDPRSGDERYRKRKPPNLDVLCSSVSSTGITLAIEGKFTEPYLKYPRKHPFTSSYFNNNNQSIWAGLEQLRDLATRLQGGVEGYERLDAAQLIKSALGLKQKCKDRPWSILYLWYDVIEHQKSTKESEQLFRDLEHFSKQVASTFEFRHLTWQHFFAGIPRDITSAGYVKYLSERYFNPVLTMPAQA